MENYVLETCYSLRDAVDSIKNRLSKIDKDNHSKREWYLKHMPTETGKTMEEDYKYDDLYLVYRNDYYDDEFLIFEDKYAIENWLERKFYAWELWEYSYPDDFLEENLTIWKFHRDILKNDWESLYGKSKQFIEGWSRQKITAKVELIPSFEVS